MNWVYLRFVTELTSLTFLDLSVNPGIKDSEIHCLSSMIVLIIFKRNKRKKKGGGVGGVGG